MELKRKKCILRYRAFLLCLASCGISHNSCASNIYALVTLLMWTSFYDLILWICFSNAVLFKRTHKTTNNSFGSKLACALCKIRLWPFFWGGRGHGHIFDIIWVPYIVNLNNLQVSISYIILNVMMNNFNALSKTKLQLIKNILFNIIYS